MGVPALFRWLSRKYPKIVSSVVEDDEDKTNMANKNPNGQEFDALYLDMNGIVHPCTHPEGKPAPETEQEMMIEIFNYTERVVNMVKPRKLLFMAIDGVAPRAKMNQQRSRRFRAAREAQEKEEARLEAIEEWKLLGRTVNEEMLNGKKAWDSNAITPGTPFMDLLASCLRYWVAKKMNSSPGWQDLTVIISDASVPGEGEHKIMDFIRKQRVQPNYNPNTKHVIYGLDADLIMLSLATHEPHFKVLREDVFLQAAKPRGCHRCGQPGHHSSMCTAPLDKIKKAQENEAAEAAANPVRKPFIFLDVGVLREYLEVELNVPGAEWDFERSLDDWVFLIFFVGNDFLPHLPSLEIREGAIDVLLEIWKKELPNMGGYMTEHGRVRLERAQFILDGLASREDEIFRKRREAEERQDKNDKRRRIEADNNSSRPSQSNASFDSMSSSSYKQVNTSSNGAPSGLPNKPPFLPGKPAGVLVPNPEPPKIDTAKVKAENMSAAERLKAELRGELPPAEEETPEAKVEEQDTAMATDETRGVKRKADEADVPPSRAEADSILDKPAQDAEQEEDEDEDAGDTSVLIGSQAKGPAVPKPLNVLGDQMVEQEDTVKLYEPGYKERYYRQKFGVELSDTEYRRGVVKAYMEGLCWVLAYYYQGCPSWQWFYPYHFAPFASDFTELSELDINFELGEPFRPYDQLMGVFPAASRQHIPKPFQGLMINEDSPIIDFYPEHFDIDMNGKKMLWQGVALLPFIEQDRLLGALDPRQDQLSDDEKRRNSRGHDAIFVHEDHPLWSTISGMYGNKGPKEPLPINPANAKGMFGALMPDPECVPGATYFSPLDLAGQGDIDNDRSVVSFYYFPKQLRPHRSVLLPGAKVQKGTLDPYDKDTVKRGGVPDRRQQNGGGGFHQNRRDIDGVGVRRPGRGGYNQGPPRNNNNGPYQGYSNNGPPQGHYPPAQDYNRGPPMQYNNAPRPYTPPAPIVDSGYPGNGYNGYRPPPQHNSYQPPSQHNQHIRFPPQQSAPYQQPPMNYQQPPASAAYGGYGQYRPPPPGQPQAWQQPQGAPQGNQAFANAQALLRSIPGLPQQPQQPYYRQ